MSDVKLTAGATYQNAAGDLLQVCWLEVLPSGLRRVVYLHNGRRMHCKPEDFMAQVSKPEAGQGGADELIAQVPARRKRRAPAA